jgi:hypothetical protein
VPDSTAVRVAQSRQDLVVSFSARGRLNSVHRSVSLFEFVYQEDTT